MQNIKVQLSVETGERAAIVLDLAPDDAIVSQMVAPNTEMDLDRLITYLTSEAAIQSKKQRFADTLLRTSILEDIEKTLKSQLAQGNQEAEINEKKQSEFKFWSLAIFGALFFACEGFNGISALMGIASVPGIISLGVALLFSGFAVMVFWGFGLRQIAEHLGVKFKDAPGLLNEYVIQLDKIEELLKTTEAILNDDSNPSNHHLDDYELLLDKLKQRTLHIKQEKVKLDEARNLKSIKVLKTSLSLVTGIIFFSSGFFTGQAVALTIAGIFVAASASFPPILAAAAFLGVVAFLVYWYLERPGIENLIGRKLGLDDEKLEKLGTERTDKVATKIQSLHQRIEEKKNRQQLREEEVELLRKAKEQEATVAELTRIVADKSAEAKTLTDKVNTESLANEKLNEELADTKAKLAESEAKLTTATYVGLRSVRKNNGELKEAAPLILRRNNEINNEILSRYNPTLFQPAAKTAVPASSSQSDSDDKRDVIIKSASP